MPYFLINGRSSHSYLNEPKFHLLVFANDEDAIGSVRRDFDTRYQDSADQQFFALDGPVRKAFGTNAPFVVLLRPDNHIALISAEVSVDRIEAYFKDFIGNRR